MHAVVDAICLELRDKKEFVGEEVVHTIYFGGGTPSILPIESLQKIIAAVHNEYDCSSPREVTIEANPDDVSPDVLRSYDQLGFNRVSLGIQSFSDKALTLMNRSHNAEQSRSALQFMKEGPIKNYSADLIFGVPDNGLDDWQADLNELMTYDPPHISCYSLTFEPNTVFDRWWESGKTLPVADELYDIQYNHAWQFLGEKGYEHYEVSNYSKPGYRAVHNSLYWDGVKYLGVGPGAHSFNGMERQWNVRNNYQYIDKINHARQYWEEEKLLPTDRLNEYLMTKLRTSDGVKWDVIEGLASPRQWKDLELAVEELIRQKLLQASENGFSIAEEDLLISDSIISSLFCAHDPITGL